MTESFTSGRRIVFSMMLVFLIISFAQMVSGIYPAQRAILSFVLQLVWVVLVYYGILYKLTGKVALVAGATLLVLPMISTSFSQSVVGVPTLMTLGAIYLVMGGALLFSKDVEIFLERH